MEQNFEKVLLEDLKRVRKAKGLQLGLLLCLISAVSVVGMLIYIIWRVF